MAKGKTASVFFCRECGYESSKWMGQCPACHGWTTFEEMTVNTGSHSAGGKKKSDTNKKVFSLNEVESEDASRTSTGFKELDRVLGGGLVSGSLILVGGDPGIGKSTLLLQVMHKLSNGGESVLYVSGEESMQQIKLRAERIGSFSDKLKLFCETDLDTIEEVIQREKPKFAVIDSVQTMYKDDVSSAPGSITQIREATGVFLRLAKCLGVTIFLVGHVTKEGVVAGPRVLEHMVDTVLYFEGDRHASYRILRGVKNRFGSTNEIGVFEMRQEGLVEVKNPSEFMLSGRPEGASGSVTSCMVEGTRPILVEIQALVCKTNFGFPRRTADGADVNRVNLLMAVLEKRVGLHMADYDAYVNIAGGIKTKEPAVDLGLVLSVASSFKNIAVGENVMCFGEVGLSGEVRGVSQAELRVKEAKKLGFTRCIVPKANMAALKDIKDMEICGVANVKEAIDLI